MNKKGCAKFLGNLKTLIFSFFMTGVVNRPPANGNNHPYIYIYMRIMLYLCGHTGILHVCNCVLIYIFLNHAHTYGLL